MLEMWMKKDNFYGFTQLASSEVSVTDLGTTGAPHLPEALDHRGGLSQRPPPPSTGLKGPEQLRRGHDTRS